MDTEAQLGTQLKVRVRQPQLSTQPRVSRTSRRRSPFRLLAAGLRHLLRWISQITVSSLILAILFFIILNFYVFSSIVNLDSFFYIFLILSLLTDGLFIFVHLPRRRTKHEKVSFDPTKLTVVIACYNGEDVLAETIKQAHQHVPLKQILVVSDASTDRTVEVARELGVRVLQNRQNLNKAFSISAAVQLVDTPYVLILDDDTLIGNTVIPTSLLDEGYTAVAFNVMPLPEKTVLNELQRFEYRNSMVIGKNLRASAGAIGNVSGAIGLFRTDDLQRQAVLHSGQFAGEDEQRTLLAHMYGTGKGITYTDSTVLTKAPATYHQLWRQRAYSWSLSVPELFTLYWRVLLSPRYHYLLKAEKGYQMYIYLTDPLRMLFLWTLFMRPSHLGVTYGFYLILNLLIWAKLGFKDTFRAIILSPLYTLLLMLSRFVGHFYWFKVKGQYLWRRLHRGVKGRKLLLEYTAVVAVLIVSWGVSVVHFSNDFRLFNKIRAQRLDEATKDFSYDSDAGTGQATVVQAPADASYVEVGIDTGDTGRALAHKAIDAYLALQPSATPITDDARWRMDEALAAKLPVRAPGDTTTSLRVDKTLIRQALTQGATP